MFFRIIYLISEKENDFAFNIYSSIKKIKAENNLSEIEAIMLYIKEKEYRNEVLDYIDKMIDFFSVSSDIFHAIFSLQIPGDLKEDFFINSMETLIRKELHGFIEQNDSVKHEWNKKHIPEFKNIDFVGKELFDKTA